MKNLAVIAVVAVLAASGGVMATMWLHPAPPAGAADTASQPDEMAELRARIEYLETRLAEIRAESAREESDGRIAAALPAPAAEKMVNEAAAAAPTRSSETRAERASRREADIRNKLLAAGWTDMEIDDAYRRRDAAALDMLEQNHLMQRDMIEKYPEMGQWRNLGSPMRRSMNEEQYAAYLEAAGRPTSARIGNLLPGSPGDQAGLREGDRILRYDGKRVFGVGELEGATLDGEYGEAVTIEVERDGSTFYFTIPRGPVGVSAFRFRD
jgi:C-terminal processing protease CtpA/Prc